MAERRPRLFLVDGSAYIFRAFFGIPALINSSGLPTNAILGFTNILLKFLNRYKPEYISVVLDAGRDTFRTQMFAGYKCNRPKSPADLIPQLPYFRKILDGLNVPLLELAGYEADDIIATLCERLVHNGRDLVVVSSDKDLMQLVSNSIKLLDSTKDRWIGIAEIREKFGVEPEQIVEVLGLMGDAVDNIPGVKGIGEKTAIALVQQFHSLENIYTHLNEIETINLRGAARICELLKRDKEMAFMSRALATVRRDVPIDVDLEQLRYTGFHQEKLRNLFKELEFTNLVELLDHGRL